MDKIAGSQGSGQEQEWDLVDVTKLPLPDLLRSDNTVLANSLRRLLAEMEHPEEIIAAHGSSPQDISRH